MNRTRRRPPGRRRGRPLRRFAAWTVLAIVGTTVLLVLPLRWLPPLTTSFMVQAWLGQRSVRAQIGHVWVARSHISHEAALAVLAAEDQKFFDHAGFDLPAIRKAFAHNSQGGRVRGASTITQQVVKNLWLWPGRSWVRKGLEAWLTLWVELLWPKERILEVYLNVAQFAPRTFGVEAAARHFFHKPAARLNGPEAALLAAVLPNPDRLRVANPSAYVRSRQRWIERQSRAMHQHLQEDLPRARWLATE